jgi:hypothetical protein
MAATIFFAYESGHAENRDAIAKAVGDFNSHQRAYRAYTWESLRVGGNILNATVLKAIEESEVFCCDLTYRNHNVLFELGYAIGKGKQLVVLLNGTVSGAVEAYRSSRIMQNIGYDLFANAKDILRVLQQRNKISVVSLDDLINMNLHEVDSMDLLFLSSRIENQAAIELFEYLRPLRLRIVQNNSAEVDYQTLAWYVSGIVRCKSVLIHLLGSEKAGREPHNGDYSLFAGLANGLGKSVMLLAPKPFRAPIDYSDILIEYEDAKDCVIKTSSWLEGRLRSEQRREQAPSTAVHADRRGRLLELGVGYETAEEEAENLLDYFIEIETYRRALERSAAIITGRKGAGKSALFIKLKDHLAREREKSFNIVLKPESDELLDNVELADLYRNDRSKRALLTTVWRLVFYGTLLRELHAKVSGQLPATIERGSVEDQILQAARRSEKLMQAGPFSTMVSLYRQWEEAGLDKPDALDHIYRTQVGPIADVVRAYFREHRFAEINLLADNLDKTWDATKGLAIQAEMVLSLLEFAGRIPQELSIGTLKTHAVLILRTDIYEYICSLAREPDKLETRRLEVDWGRFPNRLRDMLEARFRFILGLGQGAAVDHVWKEYFSLGGRKHPFDTILDVVLPRPRDVIYFVSKLFESALNAEHSRADESDFGYALEAYSNYLHRNMIAETQAQFPEIAGVVREVQARYSTGWVPFQDLRQILHRLRYSVERTNQLLDFLFGKGYLIAVVSGREKYVTDREELTRLLSQRRLLFFKRHRARMMLNPGLYKVRFQGLGR